jgi:hypothetical protein
MVLLGVFLVVGGFLLLGLGFCVHLATAPVVEPANPGGTPNPSQTPWTFEPVRRPESRWTREELTLLYSWPFRYALPISGCLLFILGTWLLSASGALQPD